MSRALDLAKDCNINYDQNILEWIKVSDFVIDAYKNVSRFKGMQDSLGFWIPRLRVRIPDTEFRSLSVELGFWIPVMGFQLR